MSYSQRPKPDPDDLWPACDEQPPGISIRPLRHGDLQALLAHHYEHDGEDEGLLVGPAGPRPAAGAPMVAVRVRASVGRPGASAVLGQLFEGRPWLPAAPPSPPPAPPCPA
jgi:hypothetical protein